MNKKEYERRRRVTAEREAKAPGESKDRQGNIQVLWDLDLRQLKDSKNPEKKLRELKARKFTKFLRSVGELTGEDELFDEVQELVELVGLQDREIEYLRQFRRDWERIKIHFPQELENLSSNSSMAELEPYLQKMLAEQPPKKKYDRKRRRYGFDGLGEIEREFGDLSPRWGEPFNAVSAYERYLGVTRLLDDVFGGGGVSMLRLQKLFGLHRNRFPKELLPSKMGREKLYDYRAMTKIMDALLNEKPRKRIASKRGRPARQWLSDSALRARVLSRIEKRIKDIPVKEHIAQEFVAVVRRHMPTFE